MVYWLYAPRSTVAVTLTVTIDALFKLGFLEPLDHLELPKLAYEAEDSCLKVLDAKKIKMATLVKYLYSKPPNWLLSPKIAKQQF